MLAEKVGESAHFSGEQCPFLPLGRILRQLSGLKLCSPHSRGTMGFLSGSSLHSSLLCGLQMNGTRPATGSTRLSPWDKSSHSGHRVDLSAV